MKKDALSDDIGHVLRCTRLRNGMSLREMGKMLGVSGQTVYMWETGRLVPSFTSMTLMQSIIHSDLLERIIEERVPDLLVRKWRTKHVRRRISRKGGKE